MDVGLVPAEVEGRGCNAAMRAARNLPEQERRSLESQRGAMTRTGGVLIHATVASHVPEKASPALDAGWTPIFRQGHAQRIGGPVAQWSELAAHNRLVAGSSPAGPTKLASDAFQPIPVHAEKACRISISYST